MFHQLVKCTFTNRPNFYIKPPSHESIFKYTIIFCNLYNIDKSPVYTNDNIQKLKLGTIAIGKGILYQVFYPIAPCIIVYDMLFSSKGTIMTHFIPASVYFNNNELKI